MKIHLKLFCHIIVLCFIIIACIDQEEKLKNSLQGDWIVVTAKRNNRETRTLKDAFFRFLPAGVMETNILGDSTQYSFDLIDSEIIQNSEPEIKYQIHDLRGDTIHLKSKIRNYNFDFIAVKDR